MASSMHNYVSRSLVHIGTLIWSNQTTPDLALPFRLSFVHFRTLLNHVITEIVQSFGFAIGSLFFSAFGPRNQSLSSRLNMHHVNTVFSC